MIELLTFKRRILPVTLPISPLPTSKICIVALQKASKFNFEYTVVSLKCNLDINPPLPRYQYTFFKLRNFEKYQFRIGLWVL